jgi:predicted RNA binding protein YcfA (HicA-like mRNA interferase family)
MKAGKTTSMERNSRKLIRKLEAEGWFVVTQRGSHVQLKHPQKPGRVTVPNPKRDLPTGTVRSIYRQAGWH